MLDTKELTLSTSKRAAPEPQPPQCDAEECETGCACPWDCVAATDEHKTIKFIHPALDTIGIAVTIDGNVYTPALTLGIARDSSATPATPATNELETVDAIGVRADGTQDALGKVAMPPKMKAREMVREYFGAIEDGNDADMALYICECLIDWMAEQAAALAESQGVAK